MQAEALFEVLLSSDTDWSHGYELTQRAGLKSGTLYPLLMRLEAQGLLEAQWQPSPTPGRPPRHVYRLTSSGRELAKQSLARRAEAAVRLAGEGA